MALNIDREVSRMEAMTVNELHSEYKEAFGEDCRSRHKRWLIRRIAWRLQANEEGDLSERARRRAMVLANDADLRLNAPATKPVAATGRRVTGALPHRHDSRVPVPGTVLTREYKGEMVTVTVLPDGFEHRGEVYKSLSAAAKAITGTHTSGFLFFRLNNKEGRR